MFEKTRNQNTSFTIPFKRTMYSPFIFEKKNKHTFNRFINVMVLTYVMTSLLPRLYDVPMIIYFGGLIFLSQQMTCNKPICKENLVL